jgi:hypothetical protein
MKSDDVKREITRMTDNLKQVNDLKFTTAADYMEIGVDKDYEIGTIEECEKFAESRRKPFEKNE